MREEWRPVPSIPVYEVSEYGNVRKTVRSRHKAEGELIAQFVRKNGYHQVILHHASCRRRFLVHRLVALAFIGDQPSVDHEIAHIDGVPSNNHVSNLEWKTHISNERDKVMHGTLLKGSLVGTSKLTESTVSKIKRILRDGGNQSHLAKEIGVSQSTLSLIALGKTWRHVS